MMRGDIVEYVAQRAEAERVVVWNGDMMRSFV